MQLNITEILSALTFIGSLAAVVIGLKINNANLINNAKVNEKIVQTNDVVAELKNSCNEDMGDLKLDIANLKTDIAKEYSSLYKQIMENMNTTYMSREMSTQMHSSNLKRLDGLDGRFGGVEERLDGIEDLLRRSANK